jgi:hypothetical protein
MKDLLLAFFCLWFLALVPEAAFGFWQQVPQPADFNQSWQQEQEAEIVFSDPQHSRPANNFAPGQKVFIRVQTTGGGDQKKLLRLLDSSKKEVLRKILTQQGKSPYVFIASFMAPADSGVYYVDIKIESSQGFSFASQQNLMVGEQTGGVSVSSQAESVVDTGSQTVGEFKQAEEITAPAKPASPSSPASFPVEPFRDYPSLLSNFAKLMRQIFSSIFSEIAGLF